MDAQWSNFWKKKILIIVHVTWPISFQSDNLLYVGIYGNIFKESLAYAIKLLACLTVC